MRVVRPHLPDRSGVTRGLSWNLFLPTRGRPARGGVVVLHGAGSRKENHHDFARVAADLGIAALVPDLRGHGESTGDLDAGAVQDIALLADELRAQARIERIALRGSSMGGYFALVAAEAAQASAVVAICPAAHTLLRAGLDADRFTFRADPSLGPFLDAHDDHAAIARLAAPVLLLHAQGDESVPVEHSRALAGAAADARLIEVPGGHHRSIQHDAELQGETVRFLRRAL